jgi:hypothetical protein
MPYFGALEWDVPRGTLSAITAASAERSSEGMFHVERCRKRTRELFHMERWGLGIEKCSTWNTGRDVIQNETIVKNVPLLPLVLAKSAGCFCRK